MPCVCKVGCHTLLEASSRYWRQLPPDRADRFRFLHTATDEVYGLLGHDGRFTETTADAAPYSASTAVADHLVYLLDRTPNFSTSHLRLQDQLGEKLNLVLGM